MSDSTSHAASQRALSGQLRISEIFYSLQGESRSVGWPTVFVRLTGCPLRCVYCDTSYAFQGGEWRKMQDILDEVATYQPRFVTVTGGEPLAQKDCPLLLEALCDAGYEVSLETCGALDISALDPRVIKVMDLKTPDSGEAAKNRWDNLQYLAAQDQVKFVLCSRSDYDWACEAIQRYRLADHCEVLMSPCFGTVEPRQLAEWILQDRLPVRFQLQLHKILWGEEQGR